MIKQIVAAGGDALTDVPLHYYIFAQTQSEKPKVCFLPTASGDNEGVIKHFFHIFGRYHCTPDYLPLFHNKEKNIREFLLSQDIILVGGGHSASMMFVWQGWGLDRILFEAYNKGVILSGGSAGAVCWFDDAMSDSAPNTNGLAPLKCLGFLPYSNCPHYRARERRVAYKSAILEKRVKPGYAVNDGAAIHFKDGKFFRAVNSDPDASSFYVDIDLNGKEPKIHSERLPTSWLGSKMVQEELIWPAPAFRYLDVYESAPKGKTEEEVATQVID